MTPARHVKKAASADRCLPARVPPPCQPGHSKPPRLWRAGMDTTADMREGFMPQQRDTQASEGETRAVTCLPG